MSHFYGDFYLLFSLTGYLYLYGKEPLGHFPKILILVLEQHESEEMMKYPIHIYTNKLLGRGQSNPKDKCVFYTKFQCIIAGISNLCHI